jgi:hypothetical protein
LVLEHGADAIAGRARAVEHLIPINQLAALRLVPPTLDLLAPLQANLVVLFQQPKPPQGAKIGLQRCHDVATTGADSSGLQRN